MTIPQHISIMRESLGPGFPDSGWMTGKQILALAMSRVIGTPYKRNEANAGIRDNLFNILLIQSGKRGINIDRQKARELINSIFFLINRVLFYLFQMGGIRKSMNFSKITIVINAELFLKLNMTKMNVKIGF